LWIQRWLYLERGLRLARLGFGFLRAATVLEALCAPVSPRPGLRRRPLFPSRLEQLLQREYTLLGLLLALFSKTQLCLRLLRHLHLRGDLAIDQLLDGLLVVIGL
jgi:hypothetical protein